jgi:hypothetical protein
MDHGSLEWITVHLTDDCDDDDDDDLMFDRRR